MLTVSDLTIRFAHGAAVEGLSFHLARGKVLTMIGESGSGKTLTGLAVMGLLPPSAQVSGQVHLNGRALLDLDARAMRRVRGREVAMVYQNPLSALNPIWPVGEQIAEALRAHGLANRRQAQQRAVALLERVGLPDPLRVARLYPFEISGGMRQRVVIAMALSCDPALLIADEPTTALDVTIKAQILDLLADIVATEGISVLLITHDMHVVARIADKILVLYAGRLVETGDAAHVLQTPGHPYTLGLLRAADIRAQTPQTTLHVLPGQAPRIGHFPSGCRFHPRCAYASATCTTEMAPVRVLTQERRIACHHSLINTATGPA